MSIQKRTNPRNSRKEKIKALPWPALYDINDEFEVFATCLMLRALHEHPVLDGYKAFVCALCGCQETPMVRRMGTFAGTENSRAQACNACGIKVKREMDKKKGRRGENSSKE
jgi:hypothetical protein